MCAERLPESFETGGGGGIWPPKPPHRKHRQEKSNPPLYSEEWQDIVEAFWFSLIFLTAGAAGPMAYFSKDLLGQAFPSAPEYIIWGIIFVAALIMFWPLIRSLKNQNKVR